MMSVLSYFWLCALIALLIGVLTGWWIWAKARYGASQEVHDGLRDLNQSRTGQALLRDTPPAPMPITVAPPPPVKPMSLTEQIAVEGLESETTTVEAIVPEMETAPVAPVAEPVVEEDTVIVAAEPKPAPAAKPQGAAHAVAAGLSIAGAIGDPDNLELIKGVGPKLNSLLISLGVLRFDQIAAWTGADAAAVDEHLGNFKGRIERDNWVDQAGYLAKGDVAGFEAKYGALGGEIK